MLSTMWKAIAVSATASMPRYAATRMVTRLIDCSSATRSGVGPRKSLSKLFGRQRPSAAPVDHHRRIEELLAGRDAVLQRGQIDERLEARSRLALRLRGSVELADIEAPAADQGERRGRSPGRARPARPAPAGIWRSARRSIPGRSAAARAAACDAAVAALVVACGGTCGAGAGSTITTSPGFHHIARSA